MPSERKVVTEFIQKYKELECLWKVSDMNYKNTHRRQKAKEELVEILRQSDENANIYTVSKKINSLRSSFNKERGKIKYSSQSGAEDVHVPKLWYYNMLSFLIDENDKTDTSTDSTSMERVEMLETSMESFEDNEAYIVTVAGSPQASPQSSHTSSIISRRSVPRKMKRKMFDSYDDVLAKVSHRLESSPKPRYGAFGEHIAERLRSMPSDMALFCEKLINDAIFHADFGHLNHTSRIVTDP